MLLQQLVQACRTWVRRGPIPHTLSARSPRLERKLFGSCFGAPAFARRHASHVVRTVRIAPLCTMAPAVLQLRTLLHSVSVTRVYHFPRWSRQCCNFARCFIACA